MAANNPMAGPDFVEALRNVLEERAPSFTRPPSTGGTQVSLRFREDRLALLDRLSEYSGWNRNQIVDALTDKGLFVLFVRLSDDVADEIMGSHAKTLLKLRRQR